MKTVILQHKDRGELLKMFTDYLKKDLVFTHSSTFYDETDENHKAVICYYV